jgi:hypothetical protein
VEEDLVLLARKELHGRRSVIEKRSFSLGRGQGLSRLGLREVGVRGSRHRAGLGVRHGPLGARAAGSAAIKSRAPATATNGERPGARLCRLIDRSLSTRPSHTALSGQRQQHARQRRLVGARARRRLAVPVLDVLGPELVEARDAHVAHRRRDLLIHDCRKMEGGQRGQSEPQAGRYGRDALWMTFSAPSWP